MLLFVLVAAAASVVVVVVVASVVVALLFSIEADSISQHSREIELISEENCNSFLSDKYFV